MAQGVSRFPAQLFVPEHFLTQPMSAPPPGNSLPPASATSGPSPSIGHMALDFRMLGHTDYPPHGSLPSTGSSDTSQPQGALLSQSSLTSTAGMIPPRPVGPPPWLPFAPPSGLRAHFRPPGPPPPSTPPPRGPASVVNEPLLSSPPRGAQLSSRHSPSAVLLHQTVADDHGNPSPSIAPPREPPPGTPPGGSSLYLSPRLPRNTPPPPLPLTGSPAAGAESAHGNPGSIGHSLRSREIVMPAGSPLEGSPVTPLETALPHATHEASSDIAQLGGLLPVQSGKVSLSRQPLRGQAIGIPSLDQSSTDNASIALNFTSSEADTNNLTQYSPTLVSTSDKFAGADKSDQVPTDVVPCSEHKSGTPLSSKNVASNEKDLTPRASPTLPPAYASLPPPSGIDTEMWSAALAAALGMQSRLRASEAAVIPFSSETLADSNKNIEQLSAASTSPLRSHDKEHAKPTQTAERLLDDDDDEWQEVKALCSIDAHQDLSSNEQLETEKDSRHSVPRSFMASTCQEKDAQVRHQAEQQLDKPNQIPNAEQSEVPKHAWRRVEAIGGHVVLRHGDITASRWIQVDVDQGELIVFREQPSRRSRELNRIPIRGAIIDFETSFLDIAGLTDVSTQAGFVRPAAPQNVSVSNVDETKLPNKLAAFRIKTVVEPSTTWVMQPLSSALSVRWVGVLIDVATGGDARTFFSRSCNVEKVGLPAMSMSAVSGSRNFQDRCYTHLLFRNPGSDQNGVAKNSHGATCAPAGAATSKIECICNYQGCDLSSVSEVELVAEAALRSRRLKKVAVDATGDRRAAERLVFQELKASRPTLSHELFALVAKVVAAVHAPAMPVHHPPTLVQTVAPRSQAPIYLDRRAMIKKLSRAIAPNRPDTAGTPMTWRSGKSCSSDDFRFIRWLKTHCPTIQLTDSLCECLKDGVAMASVLEDALGYTLPIERSPKTLQAEHENWKICLTIIRRSGRVDGFFASKERVVGALSVEDSVAARSICGAVFTAYVTKRLRISAIRLVQWYDRILRLYDFGLGHSVGTDYVLPERDAWTIPIAGAFADGLRLEVIFSHFFGDEDDSSCESQSVRNVSDDFDDASRRLGRALTRAAGALIPCFFSCGRDFKSALEASPTVAKKTECERVSSRQDRDFALLQFHFFWLRLKDRVPTKPRTALRRDGVLQ